MTPVDYRNETFEGLRNRLQGQRQLVYGELKKFAPCTTRALAERSRMDILSVRPRMTELVELGLAECIGGSGGEGVYRAVDMLVAEEQFELRCRNARQNQMQLF